MIVLTQPAEMRCEEKDCERKQFVKLVLMVHGGFGFAPYEQGWQLGHEGGGYTSRCPKHHRSVIEVAK